MIVKAKKCWNYAYGNGHVYVEEYGPKDIPTDYESQPFR